MKHWSHEKETKWFVMVMNGIAIILPHSKENEPMTAIEWNNDVIAYELTFRDAYYVQMGFNHNAEYVEDEHE